MPVDIKSARGLVASRLMSPRRSRLARCAWTVDGEDRSSAAQISRTVGGVIGSQIAAALIAARTIGDSPIPQEWGYTAAWTASAVSGALALAVAAPLLAGRRRGAVYR